MDSETVVNELAAMRQQLQEANLLVMQLSSEMALLVASNTDTQQLLEKGCLKSKQS